MKSGRGPTLSVWQATRSEPTNTTIVTRARMAFPRGEVRTCATRIQAAMVTAPNDTTGRADDRRAVAQHRDRRVGGDGRRRELCAGETSGESRAAGSSAVRVAGYSPELGGPRHYHLAAVLEKLGVRSRTEAVSFGVRKGLVPL